MVSRVTAPRGRTEKFLRYRHDTDRDQTLTSMSMAANFLYVKMMANDRMNTAGVMPLVPEQFTRLAEDLDVPGFWQHLRVLEDRRLVVVDRTTGEAMIRSYVRHSRVMSQPNRVTNLAREVWPAIFSAALRANLVVELARVMAEEDDIKTWPRLAELAPDLHTQVRQTAKEITVTGEIPGPERPQAALELDSQFGLNTAPEPLNGLQMYSPQPVEKPVENPGRSPY